VLSAAKGLVAQSIRHIEMLRVIRQLVHRLPAELPADGLIHDRECERVA
jgi:hypothetical protein